MALRTVNEALHAVPITDGTSTIFFEIDCSHQTEDEDRRLCLHPEYAHLSKILVEGLGLGKDGFAPGQLAAIYSALNGSDLLLSLPPGSGKSAIFQTLGLHQKSRSGITIVLVPLVSLLKDQLVKLGDRGIIASGTWFGRHLGLKDTTTAMLEGDIFPTFFYLTPESFFGTEFQATFRCLHTRGHIARIVVDEAQTILEWKSFKKDYSKFRNLKQQHEDLQIIAISGSMSPFKAKEIAMFLGISGCKYITKNPDRRNLIYSIMPKTGNGLPDEIIDFLKMAQSSKLPGIIYSRTPSRCNQIAAILKQEEIDAVMYHGGDDAPIDKDVSHRKWQNNEVQIMVATIAFGLGIDKHDVRFVIHADLPKSMSHYIQETGRAGRDNKSALCILLYRYSDATHSYNLAKSSRPPMPDKELYSEVIPDSLELLRMCENHPLQCRREHILDHYRIDSEGGSCGSCDVCLTSKENTHIYLPVKVKHLINFILDVFFKNREESFLNVNKLTELVIKNLGMDDKDLKATFDLSKRACPTFGITCKLFYSTSFCNLMVEKTIIHLILECVLEEKYDRERCHFYLQINEKISKETFTELLEGATINLRMERKWKQPQAEQFESESTMSS